MGKKSSATAVPKISSTSALTTSSSSASSNKSSILKSSFAPSYLQLRLFASVIQSFESQQLRIHDTSNGRLRQQHSVLVGTNVTCLDWGCYGDSYRERRASSKKKRKRAHDDQEDVVVAYGSSNSEICMFSPAQGEVVGTLKGGHEREIRDFKFLPEDNLQAWSIGGDGKLVHWNLQNNSASRTISLTDPLIRTLCSPSSTSPQIICSSVTPYTVHIESKDDFRLESYDAFKQPVHTLIRADTNDKSSQKAFLAADQNRYINVYDVETKRIVRTLVAGGDVDRAEIHRPVSDEAQMLAVVTRDGAIEVFSRPFALPQTVNGDMKANRKSLTRKANATVKLVNSDKKQVAAFAAHFDGPNLIIGSIEGGVEPVFQKLRWQDEGSGELLFEGTKEVVRARAASTLNTATMNGAKDMGRTHVNDAKTVVVNGLAEPGSQIAPVEIESSDDDEDNEDEQGVEVKDDASENGSASGTDQEMADADQDLEGTTAGDVDDAAEPSFGELLAARHPEAISIVDTLPTDSNALAKVSESKQAVLPSGMSLGTVLTQSLRTNDQSLLETCLHVTDENVIQNTILRLESSLAANLLTKLAERLADRPGRYGHLLTWVQSTMIAHGGAIASQAGVASKLRTLYQVLNERSKILPSILLLRGKLDMMSAQQAFRSQTQSHRRGQVDVEVPLYIEGEADNWSSDEESDEATTISQRKKSSRGLEKLIGGAESSEDEDMPLANGTYSSGEEDDQADNHERQPKRTNGVVDIEADVSDEEEESGSEESEEEEESDEEEDSSMVDFINDGEVDVEENDSILDDEPERPKSKKSKHR